MKEIEIKLRVKNLEEFEKRLLNEGLVISKEVHQHDFIYVHADDKHEFTEAFEGHIALRIRNEGGKSKITLKQQKSNEMDNLEYETEVGDFKTMNDILLLMGWRLEVEVKKLRKKGKIGEYEICLDRVEGLGDFVELEKLTNDDADAEKIRDELFVVLEKYDLKRENEETRGYDTQIFQLKK